ncbi:hypothetical protein [Hymenobacter sp.]|jgi:hypothetical protein|uniref:hypothetical protein n=1 Tax=Hymenobacter sp. TaxID=1898978 RepID=UPI002ED9E232
MITYEVLERVAHANGDERTQAFAELAAVAGNPIAYQLVVDTLASTSDDQITFWCLDALIKQFHSLLPADAPRLFPLLLSKLLNQSPPISDRATWALSVTGPATVPALREAIEQAPSSDHRTAYMFALGKNKHVHTQATLVLSLFTYLLEDTEASVRYWAMVALMDMSPLRPWFDTRLDAHDFEPLYPSVLRVAEEFMHNGQDDFAGRYHDLITHYWTQSK